MLTSRFLISFTLCLWFILEEFSQYVAHRGHSFITSTKNKEGERAGDTTF